jgi:hypothetical protein
MAHDLIVVNDQGEYDVSPHAGQERMLDSTCRFVLVLAGTQSGKTSSGPLWLDQEIYGTDDRPGRGAGDYLAVTASYDLFKLKMLPALRHWFEDVRGCGRYWSGDRIIELADPNGRFLARRADDRMWGRIILRSAEAGGGLEASTAKAAWLDEAGQDGFALDTWFAVLRRLSLALGRCLLTTTIYNLGWLKTQLYDKAQAGDASIEVIQFDSTENPQFPQEEWERAKASLPDWKFNMFYRGRYDRPAGLIYDSFDEVTHTCPRFALPNGWPRYLGLDFGGVNTAALFLAEELPKLDNGEWDSDNPTGRYYLYREYLAGGRTGKEHAEKLIAGEPVTPICVGGSHSEGQWRMEFRAGGLPVREPDVKEVEIGINRVYGAFKQSKLIVFDDCVGLLEELRSYSRKLDDAGEPTETIEDKATYHRLDALRYIVGWLMRTNKPGVR